jgi:hypothetical protein
LRSHRTYRALLRYPAWTAPTDLPQSADRPRTTPSATRFGAKHAQRRPCRGRRATRPAPRPVPVRLQHCSGPLWPRRPEREIRQSAGTRAGCDTACEVSHLLDRIAVLGICAHSSFIPSGGPFSPPTAPLPQGSRRICCKRPNAYAYEDGQFLDQRIAHMSTVAYQPGMAEATTEGYGDAGGASERTSTGAGTAISARRQDARASGGRPGHSSRQARSPGVVRPARRQGPGPILRQLQSYQARSRLRRQLAIGAVSCKNSAVMRSLVHVWTAPHGGRHWAGSRTTAKAGTGNAGTAPPAVL